MEINNSYVFLTIGKTQESTETQEFKKYVGVGSSFVVAVNPTKKQLEEIYGHELANDPEYVVDTDNGKELKIDSSYRMACVGEADLVGFLKAYLGVGDAFNYVNDSWVKKDNADDFLFGLEHIKDYFSGDFSEVKDAIALQPNNKVKLLYGVRTTEEGKQYQTVATRNGMVLLNSAGSKALDRLEKELANAKNNGFYASTDFRVQPLAEYSVEPTDFSTAPAVPTGDQGSETSMGNVMPWNY